MRSNNNIGQVSLISIITRVAVKFFIDFSWPLLTAMTTLRRVTGCWSTRSGTSRNTSPRWRSRRCTGTPSTRRPASTMTLPWGSSAGGWSMTLTSSETAPPALALAVRTRTLRDRSLLCRYSKSIYEKLSELANKQFKGLWGR